MTREARERQAARMIRHEFAAASWLVWSDDHEMWWGPNRHGYTSNFLYAGIYMEKEAKACADLRSPKADRAMLLSDAVAQQKQFDWNGPTVLKHWLSEDAQFRDLLSNRDQAVAQLTAELAGLSADYSNLLTEGNRLEAEIARTQKALDDTGIGGIMDVFRDPADAITQMAAHIAQQADEKPKVEADVSRLEAGDAIWRKGWWLSHGCDGLYGDDGEMQCGKCMVDFKRWTPAEIEAGLLRASATRLRAQVAGDPRPTAENENNVTDITIYMEARPLSVLAFYRSKGFAELPPTPTMSGAEIKRFGNADATYQLYRQVRPGSLPHDDPLYSDGESIILTDGMWFYVIPPATY